MQTLPFKNHVHGKNMVNKTTILSSWVHVCMCLGFCGCVSPQLPWPTPPAANSLWYCVFKLGAVLWVFKDGHFYFPSFKKTTVSPLFWIVIIPYWYLYTYFAAMFMHQLLRKLSESTKRVKIFGCNYVSYLYFTSSISVFTMLFCYINNYMIWSTNCLTIPCITVCY